MDINVDIKTIKLFFIGLKHQLTQNLYTYRKYELLQHTKNLNQGTIQLVFNAKISWLGFD